MVKLDARWLKIFFVIQDSHIHVSFQIFTNFRSVWKREKICHIGHVVKFGVSGNEFLRFLRNDHAHCVIQLRQMNIYRDLTQMNPCRLAAKDTSVMSLRGKYRGGDYLQEQSLHNRLSRITRKVSCRWLPGGTTIFHVQSLPDWYDPG